MRIPCHGFRNIAARLQLHPLARNRGNFLPTLALPEIAEQLVADRLAGLSGNSGQGGSRSGETHRIADFRVWHLHHILGMLVIHGKPTVDPQ